MLRSFLCFLVAVAWIPCFAANPSIDASDHEGVIQTIRQLNQFKAGEQGSQRPYQLQGRLIWRNKGFFRLAFGNAVKPFQIKSNAVDGAESLAVLDEAGLGDLLQVNGLTEPSSIVLDATKLQFIEMGGRSDLKPIAAYQVTTPALWKYVQHAGTVRELWHGSGGAVQLMLKKGGTKQTSVFVNENISKERALQWLDAKIIVEGSSWRPIRKPLRGRMVIGVMSSNEQIRIEEPPVSDFAQKLARGFVTPVTGSKAGFQIVEGQVDRVDTDGFVVNGLRLESSFASSLRVGDEIESIVDLHNAKERTAKTRWTRVIRHGQLSIPPPIEAETVTRDNMLFRRVTVQGLVTSVFTRRDFIELALRSDDRSFKVNMHLTDDNWSPVSQYERNAVMRVTGVVSQIDAHADEDFVLDVVDENDISIANAPFNLGAAQARWLFGLLGLAVVFVIAWHFLLERNVRLKTVELNEINSRILAASGAVRDGILMFDANGRISLFNDNLTSILDVEFGRDVGQAEALETVAGCFDDPELFRHFAFTAVANREAIFQDEFQLKDSLAWLYVYTAPVLDHSMKPCGRIWTFDDVTQRKRLEEETLQTRKINAVGRLAGGIAHDFNNLLQVIGSNLTLIEMDQQGHGLSSRVDSAVDGSSPHRAAHAAVERAAELTRQLLTFSRRSAITLVPTNPNRVVQQTVNLLERTIGHHIRLSVSFDPDVHMAVIDSGQIEQVLLNMCLNSRDAIGVNDGFIRMTTRNGKHAQVGECVVITVEDDGCGMSDEVLEQIFDPFFTTKPIDKGTGLGLATALGAIEQMRGRIQCVSSVGNGTKFELFLPATTDSDAIPGAATSDDFSGAHRSRRVLLVDDDPSVLQGTERLLVKLGHRVVCAKGGEEALKVLSNDTAFDLVLLDLSMPGMTGRELLVHLRESYRDLKVIVCSGYSDDAIEMLDSSLPPDAFLAKPFRMDQLSEVIQTV